MRESSAVCFSVPSSSYSEENQSYVVVQTVSRYCRIKKKKNRDREREQKG